MQIIDVRDTSEKHGPHESGLTYSPHAAIFRPDFFSTQNIWLEHNRPDFQKSVALQHISEIKQASNLTRSLLFRAFP